MGFLLTFLTGLFMMMSMAVNDVTYDLASEIERELENSPAPATEVEGVAEDQTPTGKFTTATEVRPILSATKGSWVAVREYEGQDLVYFTNLLAWRCGLIQVDYAINGGDLIPLEIEPCYTDTAMPNAIKAEEIMPYVAFPLGSVETIEVRIVYDDLGGEAVLFSRNEVLMP